MLRDTFLLLDGYFPGDGTLYSSDCLAKRLGAYDQCVAMFVTSWETDASYDVVLQHSGDGVRWADAPSFTISTDLGVYVGSLFVDPPQRYVRLALTPDIPLANTRVQIFVALRDDDEVTDDPDVADEQKAFPTNISKSVS